MKRRVSVLASLAIAVGGLAQPAAAQETRHAQPGGLTSIPIARTTTSRPIPHGRETIVDELSLSVVPFNWQGLYLGLHAGYGIGQTRSDNVAPFGGYDAGTPVGLGVSTFGFAGGLQLGAAWQRGNWVFGAEGDFGYLGLDRAVRIGDDRASVEYSWYGTLTGRVGFAWDHALWYLKGGGAVARIRNTATDLDGAPAAADPSDISQITKTKFGWTIGGGLEYGLAEHWSLKAEYLYMDFGSVTSTNLDGDAFRHDNNVHTFKLGVNYRFGGVPLFIRF